jgi:hypothetical protein
MKPCFMVEYTPRDYVVHEHAAGGYAPCEHARIHRARPMGQREYRSYAGG